MQVSEIPHDMSFTLDEVLRERPNNRESMSQGLEYIKEFLSKETDPLKRAQLLSLSGIYSRILLELVQSEKALEDAIDIYKANGKKVQGLGAKMRLAVTYTWKKEFGKSDHIFLGTIEKLKATKEAALLKHLDYAYLHYGKSQFEQERYLPALDYFCPIVGTQACPG